MSFTKVKLCMTKSSKDYYPQLLKFPRVLQDQRIFNFQHLTKGTEERIILPRAILLYVIAEDVNIFKATMYILF